MKSSSSEIEIVKKLIKQHECRHKRFIKESQEAQRYYRNENDILRRGKKPINESPMRSADNRIPRNFHSLLVNQKAAYMFTAPPLFDVGEARANKEIANILGDQYPKVCKDICVNAANNSVAWVHYWVDTKKILNTQ